MFDENALLVKHLLTKCTLGTFYTPMNTVMPNKRFLREKSLYTMFAWIWSFPNAFMVFKDIFTRKSLLAVHAFVRFRPFIFYTRLLLNKEFLHY
jgi:hypothetical protein